MSVECVERLEVRLSGAAITGINPGWSGTVRADAPFAALALVRADNVVWWRKAEVAPSSGIPLALHLHPLNHHRTPVQFLFAFSWGGVQGVTSSITTEQLLAPSPAAVRFAAGQPRTFCTVASSPPTVFGLFFLAQADVSTGRTGVWRPQNRLRGAFPDRLGAALFGKRHGSYRVGSAT